jgi:hypothetical protein
MSLFCLQYVQYIKGGVSSTVVYDHLLLEVYSKISEQFLHLIITFLV